MAVAQRHVPISKVVIDEEEIAAVVDVLRSGNLREGAECAAFEEEFARSVGCRHALTASSGTAALQMAYEALLAPGDEVLVPAFTFFATASMILAVGAIPIFCDVDPKTLTLDVRDAARRITEQTAAIAPVHLFGNPCDVFAIADLAARHSLTVIWDAAQAHGTRYRGADVGSFGEAVCYSFYPTKNMTTGEGGMVCTSVDLLADRIRLLRSQGQTRRYYHTNLGYNFRMTDIQAAIGRRQLRKLSHWVEQRRTNASYLRERLAETPLLRVLAEQEHGTHSYHQFSVLVDRSVDRDGLLEALREAGVECSVHYPLPLHRQPLFMERCPTPSLRKSEDAARRILSLPVHPFLSQEDLTYVADTVLKLLPRCVKG